ncbi:peptidase domain-containing ABC transporter, partial [Flavobacterium sp. NRK1]|uniref:peptidase domain-containing ABC transporter n=1 Tax=Flavobacterium sp. NRK1 TaxID=2954929 RepID=UPI0020925046
SGLSLLFPALNKALIDQGIESENINLIKILLLSQIVVYMSTLGLEFMRNWITVVTGTHLSIRIVSDFLGKMLHLPVRFFDTKMIGDLHQRINDNDRIQNFLTSQSITTFFSLIVFSVFFIVLSLYNFKILIVYSSLTLIAVLWAMYWLRKRKALDYFLFQHRGENQESLFEILNGVVEMKLNNLEKYKTDQWEKIQYKLYKTNIRIIKLNQIQISGYEFVNQVKNILVTYLAAVSVVEGKMTLGELLSVSYIVGQMNSPVNQLVGFFRSLQDARLSFDRIADVQDLKEEESEDDIHLDNLPIAEKEAGIAIKNVSFQYEGAKSNMILNDISISFPKGTVTAIVGASGSGKTTLLKLLLKFYEPTKGQILYNGTDLGNISAKSLRNKFGIVMQDGFIFSDSIERNIATGDENIDEAKLFTAAKIANIHSYIESLPLGYKTKIGASGNGISGGQKQRILIARAIYKDPEYLILDEATSALDSENEKIIHDNLQRIFRGKTVIIIAHRLSTVKEADQIAVLQNGCLVELDSHNNLVARREIYYNLIRNQLELGT